MYIRLGLIILLLFSLLGCGQPKGSGNLENVGLLVPDTIDDQVWGTEGYKGLLKIQSELGVDVYYKEGMNEESKVRAAIDEFKQDGVNLIFGHGSEYASFFKTLSKNYPDIHFVLFNQAVDGDNITSLNFESHAMGFFGGMVAGEMSKTEKVGVLAAFEWQPEIDGFFEGAYFQNENVHVNIQYVQDWNDTTTALNLIDEMITSNIDTVYVAGDGYNIPVIEKLKEEGLYVIGYVSDQSDLGKGAVLTSTVQHLDVLYEVVATEFNNGELKSGELYFDFQDDVISLGEFSPLVDKDFQSKINDYILDYKKNGLLPNQK